MNFLGPSYQPGLEYKYDNGFRISIQNGCTPCFLFIGYAFWVMCFKLSL